MTIPHSFLCRTRMGKFCIGGLLVVASVVLLSFFLMPQPAAADTIDAEELFESAARLTVPEAVALADYLDAPAWGIARGSSSFHFFFTGLAQPIGAYTGEPPIDNPGEPVPDGIYWVMTDGDMIAGNQWYSLAAGELLIVGDAADVDEDPCYRDCGSGFYACCWHGGNPNQAICKCIPDGQPAACETGGPGATYCELESPETGGDCEVKCDYPDYYACCYLLDPHNKPRCVCVPYDTDPPAGSDCTENGARSCGISNPTAYLGDDEIIVSP